MMTGCLTCCDSPRDPVEVGVALRVSVDTIVHPSRPLDSVDHKSKDLVSLDALTNGNGSNIFFASGGDDVICTISSKSFVPLRRLFLLGVQNPSMMMVLDFGAIL